MEGADPETDKPEADMAGENQGGRAEVEWTYHYRYNPDKPLKEKPKFFFTANSPRCKEVKRGNAEIGMDYQIYVESEGEAAANTQCEAVFSVCLIIVPQDAPGLPVVTLSSTVAKPVVPGTLEENATARATLNNSALSKETAD
jgi:hypothetical protein